MIKRHTSLILTLLLALTTLASTVFATPKVIRLELQDATFTQCTNGVFEGTYRLKAYDDTDTLINDVTPVEARAEFIAGGNVVTTPPVPHLSGVTYNILLSFPDATLNSGQLRLFLGNDPSVSTATLYLDCAGGGIAHTPPFVSDGRINYGFGDLDNVLYNSRNTAGDSEIQVYNVNGDGAGAYVGTFTQADFAPYLDTAPKQNTKIATVGMSTLYALSSGEFQIDIGPNIEGKVSTLIFDALPFTGGTLIKYNIYGD